MFQTSANHEFCVSLNTIGYWLLGRMLWLCAKMLQPGGAAIQGGPREGNSPIHDISHNYKIITKPLIIHFRTNWLSTLSNHH